MENRLKNLSHFLIDTGKPSKNWLLVEISPSNFVNTLIKKLIQQ